MVDMCAQCSVGVGYRWCTENLVIFVQKLISEWELVVCLHLSRIEPVGLVGVFGDAVTQVAACEVPLLAWLLLLLPWPETRTLTLLRENYCFESERDLQMSGDFYGLLSWRYWWLLWYGRGYASWSRTNPSQSNLNRIWATHHTLSRQPSLPTKYFHTQNHRQTKLHWLHFAH